MFSIGVLARKAECTVPTIRYYEQIGLMAPAERREGGHRVYERRDLARLVFIRRCRDLDMPLERIRQLIGLQADGKPCRETHDFFEAQRAAIQARIRSLQALDLSLSFYVANCETTCLPRGEPCNLFDQIEAG